MRSPLLLCALTGCLLVASTSAHAAEVQLWVYAPDDDSRARLRALPLGFAEGQRGDWLRMVGEDGVQLLLDDAGLAWELQPPAPPTPAGYTSPEQMVAALEALASAAPGLVQQVDAGFSLDGRALVALRISAAAPGEERLGWRILGTHHGDELSSAELALLTADTLVEGYGEDARITRILDRDAVWVMPHVNPDGVAAGTRSNARGVDLNRNYSHEWSATTYGAGSRPFSEPETRAVRALSTWTALGAGLSMHSGAANLGWLWNYTTARTPDDALLEQLAEDYLGSCTVEDFWITNGADWYATNGDTNDWSYGRHGVLDYTLEASVVKTPAAADMPALGQDHIDAVIEFLDEDQVVWGQVLGPDGRGLQATVRIDASPPLSTDPEGHFGRPVAPGPWQLRIEAPGFSAATVELAPGALPLEVQLEPAGARLPAPEPVLLPRAGAGRISLDVEAEALELVRIGELPVPLQREEQGWVVPLEGLQPGPWSLRSSTGDTRPNAVFIGEHGTAPEVRLLEVDAESVVLELEPPAAGARAWAFIGADRQLQPLATSPGPEGALRLALPEPAPEPLDVLLLAHGHQLALLDLTGTPTIDQPVSADTGTPAHDTGPVSPSAQPTGELTACGCAHASGAALPAVLMPALLLIRRRRRRS